MDGFPPIKPPTGSEYAVLVMGSVILLVVFGLAGLGYAAFGAPENEKVVAALRWYGGMSLGLGALISGAWWIARRHMD